MPKKVDHAEMRDVLVEGCGRLFAERGYASLTMREIAGALGVSTGTLYHYFPAKEALFAAVVEAVTRKDLGAAAQFIDLPPDPRVRLAALLAHVEANEDWFVREMLVVIEARRVHGGPGSPFAIIRDAIDAYVAALDMFLGTADRRVAHMIFMAIDGVLLQRLLDGRQTPLSGQFDLFVRLLPEGPP